LYEDSGVSRQYQTGKAVWTEVRASQTKEELTVQISPARGSYPDMPKERSYQLRLPGDWPPVSVTINGAALKYSPAESQAGWRYEGNTLTTVVTVPKASVARSVIVRVRRSADLIARRAELDGFSGAMTRLREGYDSLNGNWPIAWSPDELIDAMQSGDRLTYRPQSASDELTHYRHVLEKAVSLVQAMTKGFNEAEMKAIATRVGQDWKSDAAHKRIAEYQQRVNRAVIELGDIESGAPANAASSGAN
jgi:alpha-glucosidase